VNNDKDLLFAMQKIEECPVRGHIRYLDAERLVFLGQDPANERVWNLGFRNSEGEDTLLKLSEEAKNALKWLLTENFKGERVRYPYKLQTRWVVVPKGETE
jgi:hypothetical protein